MSIYYLNLKPSGNGECDVHKAQCFRLGAPTEVWFLGHFDDCAQALVKARTVCSHVNGCLLCVPECHTKPIDSARSVSMPSLENRNQERTTDERG